jgi:hypothetical protein
MTRHAAYVTVVPKHVALRVLPVHTVGIQVHTNSNRWRRLLLVLKHSLGSSVTACQRGGPDSVTGHSTSSLWQRKWRFSQYYSLPCHYHSTNVPHSFAIYAICLSHLTRQTMYVESNTEARFCRAIAISITSQCVCVHWRRRVLSRV